MLHYNDASELKSYYPPRQGHAARTAVIEAADWGTVLVWRDFEDIERGTDIWDGRQDKPVPEIRDDENTCSLDWSTDVVHEYQAMIRRQPGTDPLTRQPGPGR